MTPTALAGRSGDRAGYAMLIALILMAVLAIIGATSLSIAGTDARVATHNRRHLIAVNAADAGTQHARWELSVANPANEGWDTADTGASWIAIGTGDAVFEGNSFSMNQGNYSVDAVYQKCANPPPGYSTEQGNTSFHSDFWDMKSTAVFNDSSYTQLNPTRATTIATIRKVNAGDCKIR